MAEHTTLRVSFSKELIDKISTAAALIEAFNFFLEEVETADIEADPQALMKLKIKAAAFRDIVRDQ